LMALLETTEISEFFLAVFANLKLTHLETK